MSLRQEQWMNVGMAFERPHDKVQKETRAGLCYAISQRNGAPEYDWIVRLTEFREKGWYWYPKATALTGTETMIFSAQTTPISWLL